MFGISAQLWPVVVNVFTELVVMAPDPGIGPNSDGLPGLGAVRRIVGALVVWGLVACVAGMLLSAALWALSSMSGNYHHAGKGKVGVLVSAVAAILIGGANTIVEFFGDIGSGIS